MKTLLLILLVPMAVVLLALLLAVGGLGVVAVGSALGNNVRADREAADEWETYKYEIRTAIDDALPESVGNSDWTASLIFRGSAVTYCRKKLGGGVYRTWADEKIPATAEARNALFQRWAIHSSMRDMDIILLEYREATLSDDSVMRAVAAGQLGSARTAETQPEPVPDLEPPFAWDTYEREVIAAIEAEIPESIGNDDWNASVVQRGAAVTYCRRMLDRGLGLPADAAKRLDTFRRWVRMSSMREQDVVLADYREATR